MATTTKLADFLGRELVNADPGTTDPAKDFIGRSTVASDKDFIGRSLVNKPSKLYPLWVTLTAYTQGQRVRLSTTEILQCTIAGTSGAAQPAPPAIGATVVDATVTWKRLA